MVVEVSTAARAVYTLPKGSKQETESRLLAADGVRRLRRAAGGARVNALGRTGSDALTRPVLWLSPPRPRSPGFWPLSPSVVGGGSRYPAPDAERRPPPAGPGA